MRSNLFRSRASLWPKAGNERISNPGKRGRLCRADRNGRLEKEESEALRAAEASNVERIETELAAGGREDTDLDQRVAGAEEDIEALEDRRSREREELMRLNGRIGERRRAHRRPRPIHRAGPCDAR